jgi:radical SAM protein with 4Fe4S-binding SPASM domain
MQWETARSALETLLASSHTHLVVNFVGGEPLLYPELIHAAVQYVEDHRPAGKQVEFSLGTNGLLLPNELEFLAKHRFRIHLSFDGLPEAQRLRGEGTFEKLDDLLDRMRFRHRGFFRRNLAVSVTVLPSTVQWLPASIRYLLGKRLPRVDINPMETDTTWWDPARITELETAFDEVLGDCVAHFERTGRSPLSLFPAPGSRTAAARPSTISMCGVGSGENLTVDVDGEAYGCVAFARSYQTLSPFLNDRLEPMRLGSLQAPDFDSRLAQYPEAAQKAEIFDHKEEKFSSYLPCRDCRYLESCSVCPVSIGHQAGNEDPRRVPDFLCAFNLVAGRLREQFVERIEAVLSREAEPIRLARKFASVAGAVRTERETG